MRILKATLVLLLYISLMPLAHAGVMDMVSDLILDSAPNVPTNHRLQFTLPQAVPPSGTIVVTLQPDVFMVPASFDYTDVDLAVWNGSAYVDRPLTASASAVSDGVAVVASTSGKISITLSSTQGISAGSKIQMRLGTNAVFGVAGTVQIRNPALQASYRIGLVTTDAGGAQIDYGTAMIATVYPVTISVPLRNIPPIISNALPTGQLAPNTNLVEVTFSTDRTATCHYSQIQNTPYDSMTDAFSPTLTTSFFAVIGNHTNGTTYTYYIRCKGVQGAMSDEYPLTFSIAATPISNTSVTQVGSVIGTGDIPNGSEVLYLSSAMLAGFTSPGSTVRVLKDGVQSLNVQASADGAFHADMANLERGTYTFTVFAIDKAQRKSASYSSTLTVGAGTSNSISNIVLPPTMSLESDQVDLNAKIHATGEATPNSTIELLLNLSSNSAADAKHLTATTTASGQWDITTNAITTKGTYGLKSRQLLSSSQSDFGGLLFAGVGEAPSSNHCADSDINGDGKVNLIDFSILLTGWGTSLAKADLNCDGKVNLADFSILLFNWTG